jgi:hypothetical protein
MRRTLIILSTLGLLVSLSLTLSCKKELLVSPSEFDSPQRAMTGDASLENRISHAMDLEALSDEELEILKVEGLEVGQSSKLSDYIAAMTGRGEVQASVNVLMERAWLNLGDEVKVVDLLELTMGQLKWSACAEITTRLVERRMDPAVFLIRGLCLRRSGDAVAAMENLEASFAREPLPREVVEAIKSLVDERSGGNQQLPSDEKRFRVLRDALGRRGPLHRLFVKHLTERSDPGWTTGTLEWFGISQDDQVRVILSRARSYRHCHALAQSQSGKDLSGKATLIWFVDGLGRVVRAEVQESDWGGHEQSDWLNACLLDQVGRLRFPLPMYGRDAPARHRVSFQGN